MALSTLERLQYLKGPCHILYSHTAAVNTKQRLRNSNTPYIASTPRHVVSVLLSSPSHLQTHHHRDQIEPPLAPTRSPRVVRWTS